VARARDETRPGPPRRRVSCVCGTAWRCLLACRHTALSHVLTHVRTSRGVARRGAARRDITGKTKALSREGDSMDGARVDGYGPVHQAPADTYRCVNVLFCALPIPLSRSRERSRVRCVREWERKEERARTCVCVWGTAIVCAAGAQERGLPFLRNHTPPPPLGLYLLLLPAGPADTHVYVYLGLQCKIWTSGERTLLLYHYHCHRLWPFVRARFRRGGISWIFRVDARAVPRGWLRRKSIPIGSNRLATRACTGRRVWARETFRTHETCSERSIASSISRPIRGSLQNRMTTWDAYWYRVLWRYVIVRRKHVENTTGIRRSSSSS